MWYDVELLEELLSWRLPKPAWRVVGEILPAAGPQTLRVTNALPDEGRGW